VNERSLFSAKLDIYLSEANFEYDSNAKFGVLDPVTDRKLVLH